jgi:hypothetical protein
MTWCGIGDGEESGVSNHVVRFTINIRNNIISLSSFKIKLNENVDKSPSF